MYDMCFMPPIFPIIIVIIIISLFYLFKTNIWLVIYWDTLNIKYNILVIVLCVIHSDLGPRHTHTHFNDPQDDFHMHTTDINHRPLFHIQSVSGKSNSNNKTSNICLINNSINQTESNFNIYGPRLLHKHTVNMFGKWITIPSILVGTQNQR